MRQVIVRISIMCGLLQAAAACHPFEDTQAHPFVGRDTQTLNTQDTSSGSTSSDDTSSGDTSDHTQPDTSTSADGTSGDIFDPDDTSKPDDTSNPDDTTDPDDTLDVIEPNDINDTNDTNDPGDVPFDIIDPSDVPFDTIDPSDVPFDTIDPSDIIDPSDTVDPGDIPFGDTTNTCGDGVINTGEACDDGPLNSDINPDACRTNCQHPFCGDGVIDPSYGERCDDANFITGDGCDASCEIETPPSCGDGVWDINQNEACDDGNTQNGDGCDESCQLEPVGLNCGDSVVVAPERCDDGNTNNGDGCNPTCNLFGEVKTLVPQTLNFGGGLAVDNLNAWFAVGTKIYKLPLSENCLSIGGTACAPVHVAGTGGSGYQDGSIGTNAILGTVGAMATDGTSVFFYDDNQVLRAMSVSAPHSVTTVAGQRGVCGIADGVGNQASFHDIRGLTVDRDKLYMLDSCYAVLRAFNLTTREVATVAGIPNPVSDPGMCPSAVPAFSCNEVTQGVDGGPGVGRMVSPRYMSSAYNGMFYIIDTNGEILRSYNTATEVFGTVAGGQQGYLDGVGRQAQLDRPRGVSSDGTSLYWVEQNAHTVRQLILSSSAVSTLAGQRGCPGPQDGIGGSGFTLPVCPTANSTTAHFDTPAGIAYHFPSKTFIVRDINGIRRIK